MKRKTTLVAGMLITLAASPFAYSASNWNSSQIYNSGDVVSWEGSTYISSHWTKGTEPKDNDVSWDGWITLDTENIPSWTQDTVYNGGDIVEFNTGYYIAKWWNKGTLPDSVESWQRIDIDSIIPVPPTEPEPNPDPEPTPPVLGVDENEDGLRDDYAAQIAQTYSNSAELALAVQSGKEFGKLLEFSEKKIELTVEDAKYMAVNAISLQFCIDTYQYDHPDFVNPIDLYFDTLERAVAKVSASARLYEALKGNEPEIAEIDCTEFIEGVSK